MIFFRDTRLQAGDDLGRIAANESVSTFDYNGIGRLNVDDVVLYFNQMSWIAANEPVALIDYNGNGRVDFADVVWLFNNL